LVPIFERMKQFGLFFVKFLGLDQCFSIKIVVVNNDFFVSIIDIILVSILMKNPCSDLRNLTKMIKLHQFLKDRDQIETKKTR